jgi:WD40 repeat protein
MPDVLAFSGDGSLLAAGCFSSVGKNAFGSIRIWNLSKSEVQTVLKATDDYGVVGELVFLQGGRELISGACIYKMDGTTDSFVQFWNVASGGENRRLKFENKTLRSLAISKDERCLMIVLASPDQQCLIQFWDLVEGKMRSEIKGDPSISWVALVPDGTSVISSGEDHVIRVRDIATRRVVRQFSVECPCSAIAVSPVIADPIAAVVDGETHADVVIWNYRTGERLRTLKEHAFIVGTMVFSPDGRMLLIGCGGHDLGDSTPRLSITEVSARVWDVQAGKVLCSVFGDAGDNSGLAFSPSGELFCTSDMESCAIRLWKSPKPIGVPVRSPLANDAKANDSSQNGGRSAKEDK